MKLLGYFKFSCNPNTLSYSWGTNLSSLGFMHYGINSDASACEVKK